MNFDRILDFFNNPWWAISVPISLIIGFIGLFASLRKKRNKIEHAIIESFDVGKGLRDDFSELRLYYKNKPISNSVWVLRGRLKNITDDIKIEKDNNEIELWLPIEWKVLEVIIKSSHEKFVVNHYLKDSGKYNKESLNNIIIFKINFSEWKAQEYFNYSIIFETPPLIKSIEDYIKVEQSLHNTDTVTKDSMASVRHVYKLYAITLMIVVLFRLLRNIFANKPINGIFIFGSVTVFIFSIFIFLFGTKWFRNLLKRNKKKSDNN